MLKEKRLIVCCMAIFLTSFCSFQVKCIQSKISQQQFPKIIWIYWQDESNLPLFCILCIENIKRLTQQDGWQIKIINNRTFYDYIEDEDYFDFVIKNKKLSWFPTSKVDLIRLFLLYQNGGVWIDISSILIQDFKWLNQLHILQNVYNKPQNLAQISHPDVFLFANKNYGSNKFYKRRSTQNKTQIVYPFPGFQTWFIAAIPKAKLISDWKKQFTQYFLKDYNFFFNKLDGQNIFAKGLDLNVYMATSGALQNVIQTKQHQLDDDQNSSFLFYKKRFAVDYYKLWFSWASQGPLLFHNFQFLASPQSFISNYSIDALKQGKKFPQYFVKITGYERQRMQFFLMKIIPQKYTDQQLQTFKLTENSKFKAKSPVKHSILDQFLLSKLQSQVYNKVKFRGYQKFVKQDQNIIVVAYYQYIEQIGLKVILLLILIIVSSICLNPIQEKLKNDVYQM